MPPGTSDDTDYFYDVSDRLISADVDGDVVFAATCDAGTRRLSKTEGAAPNAESTLYRYDGGTNFQELEDGGSGYAVVTELIRAGGLGGGIGSVLYSDKSMAPTPGPVEHFVYNAVGHTTALTNGAGAVTQTSLYEAFGDRVVASDSNSNNRLANTKERDASLGLDNHGFRYYDPETGRYITRDPIGYGDGMNVYASGRNNPLTFVDPLGLAGENEAAAEGRVAHRAIQEQMEQAGGSREQPVQRASGQGRSDVLRNGVHDEIKPASPTGVAIGRSQLESIDPQQRGHLIVYRQTGTPPEAGDQVDYARLSSEQHATLAQEIKDGKLKISNEIFERAAKLAENGAERTTVSATAAEQAGRVYYRGQAYEEGNPAAPAPRATQTASAQAKQPSALKRAGRGIVNFGRGTARVFMGVIMGAADDVILYFEGKKEGKPYQQKLDERLRESPMLFPGVGNPEYEPAREWPGSA